MLITDEENKERDHPFFPRQAIWKSVGLEIANCAYFLVSTEVQEEGLWLPQTSLVYDLRNLLAVARKIRFSQNERFLQVALIIQSNAQGPRLWKMYNLREVWIESNQNYQVKEIFVTEEGELIVLSGSTPLPPLEKKCVFSLNKKD